jgi:hypothetical protein
MVRVRVRVRIFPFMPERVSLSWCLGIRVWDLRQTIYSVHLLSILKVKIKHKLILIKTTFYIFNILNG